MGTVGKFWVTGKIGKIGWLNTTYNRLWLFIVVGWGGGLVRYFEIAGKTVPPVK